MIIQNNLNRGENPGIVSNNGVDDHSFENERPVIDFQTKLKSSNETSEGNSRSSREKAFVIKEVKSKFNKRDKNLMKSNGKTINSQEIIIKKNKRKVMNSEEND